MKKYKFRFSGTMIVVFSLGLLLCAAGFVLNIVRFCNQGADGVYEWMQYAILLFVSVFLSVLIVAMLVNSQYAITDKHLILRFGIIRTRYDLSEIASVHLFKGANKLAVYFRDEKYTAIVVKPEWYDDFVKTLLERNEKIGFSFSTAEEEDELKKKK
ncbi:MAG: PH domain-containing protein [Candidatus Gallimonas sp.]